MGAQASTGRGSRQSSSKASRSSRSRRSSGGRGRGGESPRDRGDVSARVEALEKMPAVFWTRQQVELWLLHVVKAPSAVATFRALQVDGEGLIVLGETLYRRFQDTLPQAEASRLLDAWKALQEAESFEQARMAQRRFQRKSDNKDLSAPGQPSSSEGAVAMVVFYHTLSQHTARASARRAMGAARSWLTQPRPHRRYYGSAYTVLPWRAEDDTDTTWPSLCAVYRGRRLRAQSPVTLSSLATLLRFSLSVSARKIGKDQSWSKCVNPSSGGLHPVEAYCILAPAATSDLRWPQAQSEPVVPVGAVVHYSSKEHGLELLRCVSEADCARLLAPDAVAFVVLTAIQWRETWKYGERSFRYTLLDVGHAAAAVAYAVALHGWSSAVLPGVTDLAAASAVGLPVYGTSLPHSERECAHVVMLISTRASLSPQDVAAASDAVNAVTSTWTDTRQHDTWHGRANKVSITGSYDDWPVLEAVQTATSRTLAAAAAVTSAQAESVACSAEASADLLDAALPKKLFPPTLAASVLQRRSARDFIPDAEVITRAQFYAVLSGAVQANTPSCSPGWAAVDLLCVWVQRVSQLPHGMYLVLRRGADGDRLRARVLASCPGARCIEDAPFPLYCVSDGGDIDDVAQLSAHASCSQTMAGRAAFVVAAMADLKQHVLASDEPWRYRDVHYEAGALVHAMYLHAETVRLRVTGIGCFLDDAAPEMFRLEGFVPVYQAACGHPVPTPEIEQVPPSGIAPYSDA